MYRRPLNERIADLLIYLSEHKSSTPGAIEICLTRRKIAGYVGATIESVIRVMSSWAKERIVETHQKHVLILSMASLKKIASGGVTYPLNADASSVSRLSRLWRRQRASVRNQPSSRTPLLHTVP